MKKRRHLFRNQKLIRQIGILFFIQVILITLVNVSVVYQNNLKIYIEERSQSSLNLARYVAKDMENTEDMGWLISYWRENYQNMKLLYDSEKAEKDRVADFMKKYPQYSLENITVREIEKMSSAAQKEYAECRYMQFMNQFNELKRSYHPTYLFCFYPKSDRELFYFLTGTEEWETRGDDREDIFRLGTISEYPIDDYPVLTQTWKSGKIQKELEQPVKSGELSGYYHVYAPVRENGKTICLIGVTLETNTVQKDLRQKLLVVEGMEIACIFLTGIMLLILVQGVVLRPILRLRKGMLQYEKDKDSAKVMESLAGTVSKNEIGQLTNGFMGLTQEIDSHIEKIRNITTEQERLRTELSLAASIQLDMIPKNYPESSKINLAGSMEPAREVGGDFFDVFSIDDNHVALLIGDVSGKGIPAALFMARSITVIRNFTMMGLPVDEVFTRTNQELCHNNDSELFTTSWLGIYELDSGKLVFTEAGHDEPVCLRNTGETELLRPKKKKMVLGGMPGIRYIQNETVLKPGELLLLYTDGVPEANNEKEELYGMERFQKSVAAHTDLVSKGAKEFLHAVRSDVSAFVGEAEQFDDLTMLALVVREKVEK